jgi:two-component system cell cycle sensor histidine kinase/response regulator CckA
VHQILLNLCVNARDAMPQGGTLTVLAETRQLDPLVASGIEGGRSGRFLVLGISDTGTGIPPEILSRVWEPFFTTKTAGRGTGLGLSTVRGIVENHQGFVRLITKLGQGTAFEIFLPAAEETMPPMPTAKTSTAKMGNGELILVVDDDVNVRDVIAATLVRHGYRIATATDGTEAVALFAPRNLEFRLVIADVSMPNLNGTQLARVVRSLNPAVAVIMISGLAEEQERARAHAFDGSFLPKPFSSELLLDTVHAAIHASAERNAATS